MLPLNKTGFAFDDSSAKALPTPGLPRLQLIFCLLPFLLLIAPLYDQKRMEPKLIPPHTKIFWPVIQPASSDAKKRTA